MPFSILCLLHSCWCLLLHGLSLILCVVIGWTFSHFLRTVILLVVWAGCCRVVFSVIFSVVFGVVFSVVFGVVFLLFLVISVVLAIVDIVSSFSIIVNFIFIFFLILFLIWYRASDVPPLIEAPRPVTQTTAEFSAHPLAYTKVR